MKKSFLSIAVFSLLVSNCFLHSRSWFPEFLGEPVGTTIIQGVAFGKDREGKNQLYFATNGKPATFYAVDAESMEVVFSAPLPPLDVVWAIVRAADGDIYLGGTRGGHLFRYLPNEKKIEDLGHNQSRDDWIWALAAASDGKIYGGTYPNAEIFEHDLDSAETRKWASGFTDQNYVRGIAVDDEAVYAGIGMEMHLIRIDRKSGEIRELKLPVSGEAGAVSGVWAFDNRIVVRTGRTRLWVLDKTNGELLGGGGGGKRWADYSVSPVNSDDRSKIYYKFGSNLFVYDFEENRQRRIPLDLALPPGPVRGWDWVTIDSGEESKTFLQGLTEFGALIQYDPVSKAAEIKYPKVEPQGVLVQALEIGPDGLLYLGGYQAGMSVYDPSAGKVVERYPQFNQPEGIGFFDGKVYFGTYGSARIFRLDPEKPREFGHASRFNPGLDFSVGHGQDRPFAFAEGEGKLFIGTVPGYGKLGGALTMYDGESGEWKVFPNLIENQSIIGIAVRDGKVYGSSSVFGGLGNRPKAEAARMFVWDIETETLIREWIPEIPGIEIGRASCRGRGSDSEA